MTEDGITLTFTALKSLLNYGVLGIICVLLIIALKYLASFAYNQFTSLKNDIEELKAEVVLLKEINTCQAQALSEIQGFVIASNKFNTEEKEDFLNINKKLNQKIKDLHEKKK